MLLLFAISNVTAVVSRRESVSASAAPFPEILSDGFSTAVYPRRLLSPGRMTAVRAPMMRLTSTPLFLVPSSVFDFGLQYLSPLVDPTSNPGKMSTKCPHARDQAPTMLWPDSSNSIISRNSFTLSF